MQGGTESLLQILPSYGLHMLHLYGVVELQREGVCVCVCVGGGGGRGGVGWVR